MGFIKEVYSNNRAGLVVAFDRGETSINYFNGDSIEAAMKHFNIYLKNNELYIKTEDEVAMNNLGINAEDAIEFRSTVNEIIEVLSDEQAIGAPILFPVWQAGITYEVGTRVRYMGRLYKTIQKHNSQIGWEPIHAPSLFAALLVDEENNSILAWTQPESTNGYSINDKVIHNEKVWISTQSANVWEPGTVGAPWVEYIAKWENGVTYLKNQKVFYEDQVYISLVENNTETPMDSSWMLFVEKNDSENEEILEWSQPDASNPYSIGDRIIFNGLTYESLIDNNVWSPEAYPAGWSEVVE